MKNSNMLLSIQVQKNLLKQIDIESTVIPNVFDFENPPLNYDAYGDDFKKEMGISSEEIIDSPAH